MDDVLEVADGGGDEFIFDVDVLAASTLTEDGDLTEDLAEDSFFDFFAEIDLLSNELLEDDDESES